LPNRERHWKMKRKNWPKIKRGRKIKKFLLLLLIAVVIASPAMAVQKGTSISANVLSMLLWNI